MVNGAELFELVRAVPFMPFTVVTQGGEEVRVTERFSSTVVKGQFGVRTPDGNSLRFIPLTDLASVEVVGQSNGADR